VAGNKCLGKYLDLREMAPHDLWPTSSDVRIWQSWHVAGKRGTGGAHGRLILGERWLILATATNGRTQKELNCRNNVCPLPTILYRQTKVQIYFKTISCVQHAIWDLRCSAYYAASSGNHLPTFRDNVSVPSSRAKTSWPFSWLLKMGRICCPETSVKDYHSTLRYIQKERGYHQQRRGSLKSRITHYMFRQGQAKFGFHINIKLYIQGE
jgi:hypothetical protein